MGLQIRKFDEFPIADSMYRLRHISATNLVRDIVDLQTARLCFGLNQSWKPSSIGDLPE